VTAPQALTAYRYSVKTPIRSFGDKATEALFWDEFVRRFQGIARQAKRKLEAFGTHKDYDKINVQEVQHGR
jgi:plasmid maintenance system killer protein